MMRRVECRVGGSGLRSPPRIAGRRMQELSMKEPVFNVEEQTDSISVIPKNEGTPATNGLSFLSGGGEMGALIRAFNWETTSLGAPSTWPEGLRTLVRVMLSSRQPMFIAWGPERVMLYNDGYAPMCTNRHPWALGRPFNEVWSDIIADVGPIMDAAYAGTPTYMDDIEFQMTRHGKVVETHFSFGYTPVHDEQDRVVGMFCTALEITAEVLRGKQRGRELDRMRDLLESAPSFMAVLKGPEHVFEITNTAYLRLIGHRNVIGKTIREALPDIEGQGFYELLDRVFTTGEPFVGRSVEIELQHAPGAIIEKGYLNFLYQPIRDEDGHITGVFVEGNDVTDLKLAELALRESEIRVRLALAAAEMGVWQCQFIDGKFVNLLGDDRALTLLGGKPGEAATFEQFAARIHPDDRPLLEPSARVALDPMGDGILDIEYRVTAEGGHSARWVHARAQVLASSVGKRLIGTVRDITPKKEAELRQQILTAELQHRMKNSLAMVSAIATQTLRGDDVADRRSTFLSRLEALSHAQDILTSKSWQSAPIRAVVESALAPHVTDSERFVLAGPDLELSAKQSLSIALAIHELATNSIKYGALTENSGRVDIQWGVEPAEGSLSEFRFSWREHGGPRIVAPTTKGFGTRLITRVLAADFNGTVTAHYRPEGLICELRAPASELTPVATTEDWA